MSVTPDHLGPYRLIEAVGAGGMGEVFLAERTGAAGVAKRVVVKRIKGLRADDLIARERFVNEARIAMRLDHGNIVQVFDFGEEDGQLYLVMEWVDGPSLFQLWRTARRQGERIPFQLSAFILRSLLGGLHFAHEQVDESGRRLGIVHRDVSPQNVLLDLQGQVKLTDFGIARARDVVSRTRPGIVRGKMVYFSPEQIGTGAVDRRTDVFASGVILYQLLTGSLPVLGEFETVRRLLLSGGWARASMIEPALPAQLEEILEQAMAVDPGKRFPTAEAFQDALDLWLRQAAPGVAEDDLADYLVWVYRNTDEGRESAAELPTSYSDAMKAWEREIPASSRASEEAPRTTSASGTAALDLAAAGAAPARRGGPRLAILALAALILGAGGLGWWVGRAPTPPAPVPVPTQRTPQWPTPGEAPVPLSDPAPPADPKAPGPETDAQEENGVPVIRKGGEHSLLPEGGERVVTLSALAVAPEAIGWKFLPLSRRGATRLTVEGQASLGGLVPRRVHTVVVYHFGKPDSGLHLLRPDAPLLLRGGGRVGLAICDPEGSQDNIGFLEVEARAGHKRLGRRAVDALRDSFRADISGGLNLVGLRPSERYLLEVENAGSERGGAELPPVLWVYSVQAAAAVTRHGEVDFAIGLLRPGESADVFGTEMLSLLTLTEHADPTGALRYRIRIRRLAQGERLP